MSKAKDTSGNKKSARKKAKRSKLLNSKQKVLRKKKSALDKRIGAAPSILRALEPRIMLDASSLVTVAVGVDVVEHSETTSELAPEAVSVSPVSNVATTQTQNSSSQISSAQSSAGVVDATIEQLSDANGSINSVNDSNVADAELQSLAHDINQSDAVDLTQIKTATIKEVVFVDTQVANYQQLIDAINIKDGFDVFMLRADQDGVEQIVQDLAGLKDIEAIHIVSHGSVAKLILGNTELNLDTMQGKYKDDLTFIAKALTVNADILIYGCNFGDGNDGYAAMEKLSELTTADIEASTDSTGSSNLGGDWTLERTVGDIDKSTAFDLTKVAEYDNMLVTGMYKPVVGITNNASVDSSGIMSATATDTNYLASTAITAGQNSILEFTVTALPSSGNGYWGF